MAIHQVKPGEYIRVKPSKFGVHKVYLAHSDYGCEGQVDVKSGIATCRRCKMTSKTGPFTCITSVI